MLEIYKKVFDKTPTPSLIIGRKNIISDVNKAFCKYFKIKKEIIEGKHLSLILSDNSVILELDKEYETEKYSNV
jgi:PAS domain S-box-containing protein